MARKNVFKPTSPIATNQSLAANFLSAPTVIDFMDNCSYQINVATTNSQGTFSVQASLDYGILPENQPNAGNWVDLPLGGTPTVAAANDTIIINLNQLPFHAIRLAYTSTVAGTGTCTVYMVNKEIGG